MVELSFRKPDGASALTERFERLQQWSEESSPATQHAVTRSAFARLRPLDLGNTFSDAVDTFVMGLETRFQRHADRRQWSPARTAD